MDLREKGFFMIIDQPNDLFDVGEKDLREFSMGGCSDQDECFDSVE